MGMDLTQAELYPGETNLMTKAANLVVSVKESGLSRFVADKYMWIAGMEGKEAIGGKAHLTNYRVVFKSHLLNRLRGSQTIFLPNVVSVSTTFNRLIIETEVQKFAFVMWFKGELVDAIQAQRNALQKDDGLKKLQEVVVKHPEVLGSGLQIWTTVEMLNKIALTVASVTSVLEKLSGTDKNVFLEVLALMNNDGS